MAADGIAQNEIQSRTESTTGLRDYDRLKLELAGIIRSLRQVAEVRKDKQRSDECRKLLARLAEDRFNLVVVGQFSRGKTSLMNAILGVDRLPTSVLPLTSVITSVSYGDRERVLIHWDWWSYTSEIPLAELPQYVTQEGNPGNQRRVRCAEVQLPVELLRLGFYFIDTPGVGSAIAANTVTTTAFLPEADAVIFLTSFESPLAEAEVRFLEQVCRHVRKIFVVVNKRDLVPSEQQDAVVAFVQERLKDVFGEQLPRVYAISARDALTAKQRNDADLQHRSGLPQLEADLIEFLKGDKAREFLRRTVDRAGAILSQQTVEFEVAQDLRADCEKTKAFHARLAEQVKKLQGDRQTVNSSLLNRLRLDLPYHFEAKLDRPVAELKAILHEHIQQYLSAYTLSADSVEPELNAAAHTAANKVLQAWLAEHQRDFQQLVDGVAIEELRCIDDGLSRLQCVSADTAGVSSSSVQSETKVNEILREIPLTFRDIQADLWTFEIPWWIELLLPVRPIRTAVTRRCSARLDQLIVAWQQEIVSAMKRAADDWVIRLDHHVGELIADTAEKQRQIIESQVKPEEVDNLERMRQRLDAVVSGISRAESGDAVLKPSSTAKVDHVPQSDVTIRCLICIEVEKELFDFMRHRQYELSTSEADQARHAEQGGFCGLHTWQYEAISSPQGVCSAYPPVLSSLSRRLRSLAGWASSSNALIERVRDVLPQPKTCRACQLIVAVERNAAKAIITRIAAGGAAESSRLPPLCLRHLYTVLLAKPGADTARLLIEEQARVLDRLSEDMQRYVLKHDALRRELATELEHRVYEVGLSRLVGLRNIVAPWKIDSI